MLTHFFVSIIVNGWSQNHNVLNIELTRLFLYYLVIMVDSIIQYFPMFSLWPGENLTQAYKISRQLALLPSSGCWFSLQ
jgi:hypothetical protein